MRKLYDFKNYFSQKADKTVKFKNTCSLYEFSNFNFQIFGKTTKGDERRVTFSTLKKGNVSPVKTDIKCHSFLADTFFKSDFPQFYAKFYQDMFKIFVGFGFIKFHDNCTKYTCILITMCPLVYGLTVSYKKIVTI